VVKERLSRRPSRRFAFISIERRFIAVNGKLLADQRLIRISSSSISSAVVMILDEAE